MVPTPPRGIGDGCSKGPRGSEVTPLGAGGPVGARGDQEGLNPGDTRTYGGSKRGLAGPAGRLAMGLPDGGAGLRGGIGAGSWCRCYGWGWSCCSW